MEKTTKRFIQISSIFALIVVLVASFCFCLNNANIKKTETADMTQNTTQQTADQLIDDIQSSVEIQQGSSQTTQQTTDGESVEFQHISLESAGSISASSDTSDDNPHLKFVDLESIYLGDKTVNYTMIVAFVNLANAPETWNQSNINKIMRAMNDDEPNNDVFSVHEYFEEQTLGKLNFHAYYVVCNIARNYNDYNYEYAGKTEATFNLEYGTYHQALNDATEISDGGKAVPISQVSIEYNCKLLYYPGESHGWGNVLWPHAYIDFRLISTPRVVIKNGGEVHESPFISTYAHEISHTFGFQDLYTYDGATEPVGVWCELSDSNYLHNTNAFFRYKMGVFKESTTATSNTASIRTINASGEYTLSPANSQRGTIALKIAEREITVTGKSFSEKGKEIFYVEYRKEASNSAQTDYSIPGTGIIVYRAIDSQHASRYGNAYPEKLGEVKYQVYVFRNDCNEQSAKNAVITEGNSFGSFSPLATGNRVISHYDGTNTGIVVKLNGYDANGNAKVSVSYAFEPNTYVISGTLRYKGQSVVGASLLITVPNDNGSYGKEIDTGIRTDSKGYFYMKNLKNGTKFRLYKDEKLKTSYTTINGEDLIGQQILLYNGTKFTPIIG